MRNFAKADLSREYESYCPQCKVKEPLSQDDMKWMGIWQRIGQNPWIRCVPCNKRAQIRPVRQRGSSYVTGSL